MRATNLDLARKLTGPMCEKTNSKNSRLESTETSSPSCVSVFRHFWSSVSVCSLLCSGDVSRKVLSRITRSVGLGKRRTRSAPLFHHLCLLSGRRQRGDLCVGQGSRRWGFVAKAGRQGQLVKDRAFAEVQKQKEYQRKTSDEKGGLTSESRATVCPRSKGKKTSAGREEKQATRGTQSKKNKNINIIYCPYSHPTPPSDLHMSALSICLCW